MLPDCQSNLNDQGLFWCRTFPDEGGAHCYQDSSTATFSGFSTPSSQDNRQGSCATFFWDGDFTNNRYEVESGARIGFIGNWHNDEFSSAIVQPGFRVRAFESRDFQGRELRLDSQPQYGRADFTPRADGAMGFGYFPREMNDKVSSIICERASSPHSNNTNADFSRLPVFDPDFYLFSYGDLREAFGNQNHSSATEHWLRHGISEGRISSAAFDVRYYLDRYPDLQNAFGSNYRSAIDHWLRHGISEGRASSAVFDVRYYLDRYPDLQNAFGSNYRSAIDHWLRHGVREGRQGSQEFDPTYYLTNNPDVARVYGANNYKGAIEHWLEFGRREGRRGTP